MASPLFPRWNRFNRSNQQQEQSANRGAAQSGDRADRPGMANWIKKKVSESVLNKLGPAGKLVEALLRPFGKSLTDDINKELEAADDIIKSLGVDVQKVEPGRTDQGVEVDYEPPEKEYYPMIEGPIDVVSSNVHSFSYEHRLNGPGPGNLLVRFLGYAGKVRQGPGALYRYKNVPYEIFQAFKTAVSKGKFVWDELRVRGTVSGHVYDYELEGLGNLDRVPRQAGTMRGRTGEFYMQRTFRGQRSTLPTRQVRGPRGNLSGWGNRNNLHFRAGESGRSNRR